MLLTERPADNGGSHMMAAIVVRVYLRLRTVPIPVIVKNYTDEVFQLKDLRGPVNVQCIQIGWQYRALKCLTVNDLSYM